jgi:hypothetical protein
VGRDFKEAETMEQQMITRRKAFAAAGAAAGALGATAALTGVLSVQAASGAVGDSVVGTWDVRVTSAVSGQPPSTSLVAFAPGSSLVTTDNSAPGNVSVGAWEQEGEGFRAVFETFSFGPKGRFVGTAIIRPKGTVEGDRVHGTYTVDFRPASGPTQQGVDHGTFRGSRLEP